MKRAGIGKTIANPTVFLDGIIDGNGGMANNMTDSLLQSKCKDQHFAEVTDCLKQIVAMGSQFMLGAMMGIMPENTTSYASKEEECQFVQAQVHMSLAQLKKESLTSKNRMNVITKGSRKARTVLSPKFHQSGISLQ